ncbi:hypothetical protein ABT063_24640 [Streptomyces sp. NPDC002838]|uniref:hypothetical protein n=1 Tax=Streptomyces sp. NPDC002838 TaxID=3154436 RepID=UPI0033316DFC
MTFKFEQPPAELTWYYLGQLLAAEAGTLKYDRDRYRVHGISNNAMACCWCGLLADGNGGLVLTELGRRMLADWKASPKGQASLAEWSALDSETDGRQEPTEAAPQIAPTRVDQLDLFGATP